MLDQIAQSGIRSVRLSLTNPMDASIDAVRVAHQKGLAILLEVSLNNAALYPKGTKPRSGRGRIWDMYRLSDISPELYRATLRDALQRIDSLGVPLIAVEPGNEINWGAYNGDLEIRPEANTRTARSLRDVADPDGLARGAANYVQLLKVTRAELAKTRLSAGAKVVSAGLSDIPPEHADRRGIDSIDPVSFTALLREHGLDQAADGYGMHIYPGGDRTPAAREQHVEQALSICRSRPAEGKPCWITEWGFANARRPAHRRQPPRTPGQGDPRALRRPHARRPDRRRLLFRLGRDDLWHLALRRAFSRRPGGGDAVKTLIIGGSNTVMQPGYLSSLLSVMARRGVALDIVADLAVGGTTSAFGLYQLKLHEQELADCDLLLIEYALNDAFVYGDERRPFRHWARFYEGIIRFARERNPKLRIATLVFGARNGSFLTSVPAIDAGIGYISRWYGTTCIDVSQLLMQRLGREVVGHQALLRSGP
ncbi:hypothetical protein BTHI11S_05295 [Bosea thiooxidans]